MSYTNPLVSVICPCYNHEPYLRQALDSILMQKTDFPFEVLVGEDCSPDGSREILKEYEQRYPGFFQMYYRRENMGATENGLDLYSRARGKYVIALETDDYWTDAYKLQKQADFLERHPDYAGCAHDYDIVDEFGKATKKNCLEERWRGNVFTLNDFLEKAFVFQSATFMYRNFFGDGGDYSIITKAHPIYGDVTIFSILLSRGDIYILPDNMSAYRRVIKKGGTSAASISAADPAKSLLLAMRQFVMLDEYFSGKIDYSLRQVYPVETYLSSWLRHKRGFTVEGMKYMWEHASPSVKRTTVRFALGYPLRLPRKLYCKITHRVN